MILTQKLPNICFIHIPKTAGSWFRESLRNVYGEQAVCPLEHHVEFKSPVVDPTGFPVISAHIGFPRAQQFGRPLVTILREPVNRVLSLYYFWREYPQDLEGPMLARKYSLEGFVDAGHELIKAFTTNSQAWQIAVGWSEEKIPYADLSDVKLAEMAKANLDQIAVVGLTENMEVFARHLQSRLGLKIDPKSAHVGATKRRSKLESLDLRIIRKIERLVEVDADIYRYAEANLGRPRWRRSWFGKFFPIRHMSDVSSHVIDLG